MKRAAKNKARLAEAGMIICLYTPTPTQSSDLRVVNYCDLLSKSCLCFEAHGITTTPTRQQCDLYGCIHIERRVSYTGMRVLISFVICPFPHVKRMFPTCLLPSPPVVYGPITVLPTAPNPYCYSWPRAVHEWSRCNEDRNFHEYSHGCHHELQHRSHCFVQAPGFVLDNGQQALGTYMHMGHHMAKPKSTFGLRLPHHPSASPRPPPPSHRGGPWPCPTLTTTTTRPRLGQVPPS